MTTSPDTNDCSEPDCDRRVYARGWCALHDKRRRDTGSAAEGERRATCAVDGCDRASKARGWCHAHYQRWRRHGSAKDDEPLLVRNRERECTVPGCSHRVHARDLCTSHYQRWRQHGKTRPQIPLGALPRPEQPRTSRGWISGGYRYVPVDEAEAALVNGASYAAEHRLVMARLLGRPLEPDENVHHRNGDRSDNRPENLELWTTQQPSGHRVGDRIVDAVRTLTRYAPHLLANPDA